jgi:hypothetical protein
VILESSLTSFLFIVVIPKYLNTFK